MTTNRQLYMEKRKEVHAPEEFLAAFEDNTVIVLELAKEREPSDKKYKLLSGIWEINQNALITEACDLCVMNTEPTAHRKQILVIDKGGNKDTSNRILDLMYKSGVVPCHVTFKEKKNGIKRCILQKFDYKSTVVKKMNLIIDGGNLLITVRNLSSSDHVQ